MKAEESRWVGANPVPGSGAVCVLPLNEGQGTTAYDHSQHGNDAAFNGDPTWIDSQDELSVMSGVSLDGAGDYLQIPDDPSLDNTATSVRIRLKASFWDSGTTEYIANKVESGSTSWTIRKDADDNIKVIWNGPVDRLTYAGDFNDRLIHEIVFTSDADASRIHVNGALTVNIGGRSLNTNNAPINIGAKWDETAESSMDVFSVELYDRALTIEEVKGHHQMFRTQLGTVQGQTRWFDASWTEQAAVDPDRGTRKLPVLSSPPSNAEIGEEYIDDGSNTSSGNLAKRIYDGTAWVDQN